ncbi:MAG: transcriptional repressor [Magnetococcales bacterium]|nr:transcriptional repressor [Magnetococcales bacterium]
MKSPEQTQGHRMDWLRQQLRRNGHKATHQRLEVFREVSCSDIHPDAEMVYLGVRQRLPTISRNTVYQTLQFLVEQNYIAPFGVHRASNRYDRNTRPHHHLVCLRCGKVSDCEPPETAAVTPPPGFEEWGRIDSIHLELQGICADCLCGPE